MATTPSSNFYHPVIKWLAGPAPIAWTLPWLMILLVIGTISQRYIGLFESERLFFHSWLVWLGPVPLPGLYPMLGLLAAGLIVKLTDRRYWRRAMFGSLLAHLGALLLLIGGLITATTAEEGYIMLAVGDSGSQISDYHERELVFYKDDEILFRIPHTELADGMTLSRGLPFDIIIDHYYRNSLPVKATRVTEQHRGFATQIALQKAPPQKEDEENTAGILFHIKNTGSAEADGDYLLFEPMPKQAEFSLNGHHYALDLRRTQRPLPFTVQLDSFRKFTYPGTDKASDYESVVTIQTKDGLEWQEAIRMNEPVRSHGHTLYQSSYMVIDGVDRSVLAVVKNHGYLFPYLASLLMAIGLILHAFTRSRKKGCETAITPPLQK